MKRQKGMCRSEVPHIVPNCFTFHRFDELLASQLAPDSSIAAEFKHNLNM